MSDDISVYNYKDYRVFCRDALRALRSEKRSSQIQFAEHLRCKPAYISMVLNGKADLSNEQGIRAAEFFLLGDAEQHFLMLLIQLGRTNMPALQSYYNKQIEGVLRQRTNLSTRLSYQQTITSEQRAQYYSAWYYAAVHIGLTVGHLKNVADLAKHFNLPRPTVQSVCDFLLQCGLAVSDETGLSVGPVAIHTGKDSPFLAQSHTNWRMQAILSLQKPVPSDFHYSSVVSMSVDDIAKLRETMIKAIEAIRATVRESKEETVVVYAMDLFPLIRS